MALCFLESRFRSIAGIPNLWKGIIAQKLVVLPEAKLLTVYALFVSCKPFAQFDNVQGGLYVQAGSSKLPRYIFVQLTDVKIFNHSVFTVATVVLHVATLAIIYEQYCKKSCELRFVRNSERYLLRRSVFSVTFEKLGLAFYW